MNTEFNKTYNMTNLPVYEVTLDEYSIGVYATSIVDSPAIESLGIYMSEKEQPVWHLADEEKGELLGAVLIPDKLIFRRSPEGEEFYIRFTKEVISDIHQRMRETELIGNFTIDHSLNANNAVEHMESWIKETEEDKSVGFGINEPIGTLFMKVKLKSELLKTLVKEGKLRGFSVELDASLTRVELNKQKENPMDFSDVLKNVLELENGTLHYGYLNEGDSVMLKTVTKENDEDVVSWEKYNGDFEIDNFMFSVVDGNITEKVEIKEEEKEVEEIEEVIEQIDLSKVEESISHLSKQLLEAVNGLQSKVAELETKFDAVDGISTSVEEFKLEFKQNLAKEKAKKEEIELSEIEEFDVDAYKTASNWSK